MSNTAGHSDPSSVYIKASQFFINQRLEELKNKKVNSKAPTHDAKRPSESLSWNKLYAGFQPEALSSSRVAIIGAGVAGLRTAMLLDRLKIPYKIYEANDGPGGRLYTYHFPSDANKSPAGKHDYYEVGGMRFPDNAANQPTFDLFKELGFRFRSEQVPDGELIPFVYGLDDNIRHFNSKFLNRRVHVTASALTYIVQTSHRQRAKSQMALISLAKQPRLETCVVKFVQIASPQLIRIQVPKDFTDMLDTDEQGNVYRGVDACFYKAFNDLRAKLLKDFDKEWPLLLQEWDWASTRSYLAQGRELKFPSPVIDWIEKHKSGTGRYSRAVVEVSAPLTAIRTAVSFQIF